MYGVNGGIPKTLLRSMVRWIAENVPLGNDAAKLKATLFSILDTPISPELLPPTKDGKIAQKTEDSVGPYELHDFFLYYTLRYGMPPKKLNWAARQAFRGVYTAPTIKKWQAVFYRRFFTQQFKRDCQPGGPAIGSVSLSPHGDWSMPADADPQIWIDELER